MYGQFPAKAPVDQNTEGNGRGPAKIKQGIQCRPNGSPGVQYIIYQNNFPVLNIKWQMGGIGFMESFANIIAVKCYVQLPIHDLASGNAFQNMDNAVAEKNAPWLQSYQHGIFQHGMLLQHLVSQPLAGDGQLRGR